MKLHTSSVKLQIRCPGCKKKITETVGRLKANRNIICPGCGTAFSVGSTGPDKSAEAADKMPADFGQDLKKSLK